MSPSALIIGCGYLGRRVGRLLAGGMIRVQGTVRSAERAKKLPAWGIEPILADVLAPDSLARLPAAELAVYCVGFDRATARSYREVAVEGLRAALQQLAGRVGRLVYASSTGVYGQTDGGWVDEQSPTEPSHETGRALLEAEEVLGQCTAAGSIEGVILRFSGLYGPGRIIGRDRLLHGEPINGDPDSYLNLIHIDDAARAVVAALERGRPGRLYLASDDRPASRREYYGRLAELLGVAEPRFESPAESPAGARRDGNRRVSNRRLREELGLALNYRDFETGLPAALAAERAGDPASRAAGSSQP